MISDHRIPLFLVNARLSNKSYRGYKRFGFIFRQVFAAFNGVGCQNQEDAKRLEELGCRKEVIHVVGNLKFDAAKLEERRILNVPKLFNQLGVPKDAVILVGGSTHAGEEAVLADIFKNLRAKFPNLFMVTGPQSPGVKSQMILAIEQHVDFIAGCLETMFRADHNRIEADESAEAQWVAHNNDVANATLYPKANSWYMGANIPGKPRIFMPYVGGMHNYYRRCNEIAANGYEGFVMSHHGATAAPLQAAGDD